MNSSHPAKVFNTQDGFCHTQNTNEKKGSTSHLLHNAAYSNPTPIFNAFDSS